MNGFRDDIKQEDFEPMNRIEEQKIMFSAMYGSFMSRLKKKGSNLTPPKKKRKK